ncbi:MAG: sulfurtransferase TusA family protein [Promethearchaeota archaeon]|jgi:tRNA 2-thiouridine synthesizing protein A
MEQTLNATGMKCPVPVLLTKKELKKMNPGDFLQLIADDKGVLGDIPALLKRTGDKLVEIREDNGNVIMKIEKV